MEFFTFEAADFQVLEDIEFDETIQRPEKIRFYTLDEQTVDAFEKLVPKGRVTKFKLEEVKNEVGRIRDLYQSFVVPSATEYGVREPEYAKVFPWVFPIYASPDLRAYNYKTSWLPLYDNVRLPNFYPRMLAALPRPFASVQEGMPYPLRRPTEFLNSGGREPLRALPEYELTRTQRHEDKTIDILRVPVEGTSDVVNFTGYYLAKRSLAIPNPLLEHPFLKSNEPDVIETTAALEDVVPSLDAILTHGVPVTTDPYRVAQPYLKLYDVKLTDIPWVSWKSKFPQAEIVREPAPGVDIAFPAPQQYAPPEKIVTAYRAPYAPGVSVRKWLSEREDGGEFVIQLLLSEAINNGSVESVPGVDIAAAAYPTTTVAECNLVGVSLQEFTTNGLLRKSASGLQCVPLEFIKQERARAGYLGRKPWKETTGATIRERYVALLDKHRPIEPIKPKKGGEPKSPSVPDSLRRTEVIAVLEDPRRLPEDKLRDITELLKETTLTGTIHSDPEGLFVLCEHTTAILAGDLAKDRLGFYEKWTARIDGFRVCKFCGYHINSDVLVDQEDFTEDGYAVHRTEALEEKAFNGEAIANFTTGLRAIQPLFLLDNPVDATCYLLLSILQVLPMAEVIDPLLKAGRTLALKQFGDKETDQVKKFKGVVGIATTILILQSHIPALIPRRSFGSQALKLDGYPRDEKEPAEFSVVDTMIMVLRRTFEAYPTSFKGPSSQVIRGIISKAAEIKKAAIVLMDKSFLTQPDIRRALEEARVHRAGIPVVEQPKALIPVVIPPKEFGVITKFSPCPSNRPIWTSGRIPNIAQKVISLRSGTQAARSMEDIEPAVSVRSVVAPIPKATIQALYKKKAGVQLKVPLKEGYRTNLAIASHLADMFRMPIPVRTVDPLQNPDELRDIGQGMVFEMLQAIQKDPIKRTKFEEMRTKDITLYTLFADYKEERANVNKLRASERQSFVKKMSEKTDMEREIIGELLKIGLAPYIITNRDREIFAKQAEQLQEQVRVEEDVFDLDVEIGVGHAQDFEDQGDQTIAGVDAGNYGDYHAQPATDGRDHVQPTFGDDEDTSI